MGNIWLEKDKKEVKNTPMVPRYVGHFNEVCANLLSCLSGHTEHETTNEPTADVFGTISVGGIDIQDFSFLTNGTYPPAFKIVFTSPVGTYQPYVIDGILDRKTKKIQLKWANGVPLSKDLKIEVDYDF
jgi:hypothetical protein